MNTKNRIRLAVVVAGVGMGGVSAQAAGMADLLAAISFTDVLAAVFSIGVLVIGVDLAQIGYFKVRHILKGSK